MFTYRCIVRPSWFDMNGHMNNRIYFHVFSEAGDLAFRDLGLGDSYIEQGHTVFTGDFHITYVNEIRAGGTLSVLTRILELGDKGLTLHQEMIDDEARGLAATAEQLLLNVGVASRRVTAFRPEVLERLRRVRDDQGGDPPRNVGRS